MAKVPADTFLRNFPFYEQEDVTVARSTCVDRNPGESFDIDGLRAVWRLSDLADHLKENCRFILHLPFRKPTEGSGLKKVFISHRGGRKSVHGRCFIQLFMGLLVFNGVRFVTVLIVEPDTLSSEITAAVAEIISSLSTVRVCCLYGLIYILSVS